MKKLPEPQELPERSEPPELLELSELPGEEEGRRGWRRRGGGDEVRRSRGERD